MIDYGGYIRLWESDVPLFMQGSGTYNSSYSHWMKWNLPDLTTLEHPRGCVPTRAWFGYIVRGGKYDVSMDAINSVLWTNSNVSWTSASSLATLQAIFGEADDGYGGIFDVHTVRQAKRIASNEASILIESADDMPTANETVHFFDITGRVQQIYLANNLGACQMTTRHAFDVWAANADTSVSQKTVSGSDTLFWLQKVTKPSSTKLYDGWAYSWDAYPASDDLTLWLFWEPERQFNLGFNMGFNLGIG